MSGWHYAPPGVTGVIDTQDQAPLETAGRDELAERAELLAHRQARRRARISRAATGAAGLAVLLVLWQVGAIILGDQVALPSVSQTFLQFAHYLGHPYPAQGKPLWFDLYISLRRILIGFVIGVTIGVALGAAMSAWRFARHLVDPVIEVIRPLPPLAFIPLFIIWLGIGELPKEVLSPSGSSRSWLSPPSPRSMKSQRICGYVRAHSAHRAGTRSCTCRSARPCQGS